MPVIIEIKAIPKSKISAISIDKSDRICIRITNAAENGKANQEIIKLIAKTLKLPQADIQIISGLRTRLKRIKIIGTLLDKNELVNALLPSVKQQLL
jgi:uncharacterized protein (TIGR00251 family)